MAAKTKDEEVDANNNEISNDVVPSEPVYATNEVNGKFKIMEEWSEDLKDPKSRHYLHMSETITRGIQELLEKDEELMEKADFDVTILGFK